MCWVLYIASDYRLPVTDSPPADLPFYVEILRQEDAAVRRQFSKPFIYSLGSHSYCGCGFCYGALDTTDSVLLSDAAASRDSVKSLAAFVRDAVHHGPVEMFACWTGDESKDPLVRLSVTPEYFGGESFDFDDRQYFLVSAERT